MKVKHIIIALAAALSVGLASCDDKLDIPKHGNMGGQDDFYKTDEQAMQAAASLYSSWSGNYYDWFFLKNLISDDAWTGGGSRGDNADYERLNEYTFDTDHGSIKTTYKYLYAIS